MWQELRFDIATDTGGDFSAVSNPFSGEVRQVRYSRGDTGVAAALDTGVDILLEMVNSGVVVAQYGANAASWTRVPRIESFDTGGDEECPVAAHDRLRLIVAQADGATGGKGGSIRVVTKA